MQFSFEKKFGYNLIGYGDLILLSPECISKDFITKHPMVLIYVNIGHYKSYLHLRKII